MRRFLSCFFSKKASSPSMELSPLITNNQQKELVKRSKENLETYLSFQTLTQAELTHTKPSKSKQETFQEVNAKHRDFLHKKKIFKEHPADGSAEYEELRRNYIDATYTAWAAIDSYRKETYEDEELEEGVRGYSCRS